MPAESAEHAFLITDIRGYTQFTRERGNAEAARLAQRFAELTEDAVEARGGRVVEVRGDEVLAVFQAAPQAVRAGVELAATCAEERELDPSLPLLPGVGIDIGDAVPVGDGFRGAVVNTAARLCSRATAGQVLVSEKVVGRTDLAQVRFESVGTAELKGFDAPVELFAAKVEPQTVAGPAASEARSEPLPPELATDVPLVGRARELSWLRGAWREARRGRGRVVFVSGPRGTGKTRLAAELAAHALAQGAPVEYVGAGGPATARALAAVDEAVASPEPNVLVLDDLDALGEQVAARVDERFDELGRSPVLLIGIAREIDTEPQLAAIVERADSQENGHRTLGALEPPAIRELARLYAGPDVDDVPLEAISRASGGLPGGIHELTSEWAEQEATRRLAAAAEWLAEERSSRKAGLDFANNVIGLKLARLYEDGGDTGPDTCPYKGLASFEESDARLFFGRERLVGELAARSVASGLLAVVGPSGIGKSSLVSAGLLPSLRSGLLPGSERWHPATIRPGEHPLAELEAVDPPDGRLVLVIDQFEEVFTTCRDERERREFIAALTKLADGDHDAAVVVLSVRGDFIDQCARYPRLAELISANQVLVGPMRQEELRDAIDRPARRAGLRVEAALAEALVAEVADEPGGLPLLSTALVELWQNRSGAWLRMEAYERTGGVRGAVARLAERSFEQLDTPEREASRAIFLRLVTTGEGGVLTRRRAPLSEFDLDRNPVVREVLDRLTADRLLTRGDDSIEVAHEALLREWPRLAAWLEEDVQGRHLRQHLTAAATQWAAAGRETSELYRGARLSAALEWASLHGRELNEVEREFLASSRAAGQRELRRLRVGLAALGVLLLAALVAGGFALVLRSHAQHSAKVALADSLGAQAVSDPRLDQAMLLGVEAARLDPSERTQGDLLTALLRAPSALRTLQGDGLRVNGMALSPDGRTLALEDNVPNIFFVDTATGRRVGELPKFPDVPSPLAFAPNGQLALFDGDTKEKAKVDLVDPSTRKVVRRLRLPASVRSAIQPPQQFGPPANFGGSGLSFADGGRRLAVVVADHVVQWALPKGRVAAKPLAVSGDLGRAFYLPGGRRMLVPGQQHTSVLDARSGKVLRSYPVPGGSTDSLSPSGATLLLGDDSGSVRFLDLRTGAVSKSPGAHQGAVEAVGFTPDGKSAITSGLDGKTRLWDVTSHEVIQTFAGHAGAIDHDTQAISGDGKTLYTGGADGNALVWDLDGRRSFGSSFPAAHSNPDAGAWNGALSPDGRLLAVGATDGTLNLWDARSHRKIESFRAVPGAVAAVSFGAGGRTLLVAGITLTRPHHGYLRIWSLRPRPRLLHQLRALPFYTWATFSPDGKTVAATGVPASKHRQQQPVDGAVAEWNAGSGRLVAKPTRLHGGGEAVDVTFAAHGTEVAVAQLGNMTEVVDPFRRKVLVRWHDSSLTLSAALAPDGKRVVTANFDGYLQVRNAATGRPLLPPIHASEQDEDSVSWSPDGKRLAAVSSDGTARLFDASSGLPVGTALPIANAVSPYVTYSADGSTIAVADVSGRVWLYPATVPGWTARACRLANRNLTRAEWARYVPGHSFQQVCVT